MTSEREHEKGLLGLDSEICTEEVEAFSIADKIYMHGNNDLDEHKELPNQESYSVSHVETISRDFQPISQAPSSRISFMDSASASVSLSNGNNTSKVPETVSNKDQIEDGAHYNLKVQNTDYVYLNRLPGENLGMVLGIEGDQENRKTIDAIVVKSVTPGGAVARSCQGSNRILVGDEILEIDGRPLNQLTHDECIALFQDIPDNVVLTVYRKETDTELHEDSVSLSLPMPLKRKGQPMPRPRKHFAYSETDHIDHELYIEDVNQFSYRRTEVSTPGEELMGANYKVPSGFRKMEVMICRREDDSLGLSIVPSYGATCDLYQIKRLLNPGACAHSGLLEVGDRLLACNGHSLKGLTQIQCLNALKSSGALIQLVVLRQTLSKELAQPAVSAAQQYDLTKPTLFVSDSLTDVNITRDTNVQSNNLTDVNITQDDIEGNILTGVNITRDPSVKGNNLTFANVTQDTNVENDNSHINISEDLTGNAQAKEFIHYSKSGENSLLSNLDSIQFSGTVVKITTRACNHSSETNVHGIKERESLVNITPPGEFSDGGKYQYIDFTDDQRRSDVSASSLGDLLFEAVADSQFYNSETYNVLDLKKLETDNRELSLILLDETSGVGTSLITLNETSGVNALITPNEISSLSTSLITPNETTSVSSSLITPNETSGVSSSLITLNQTSDVSTSLITLSGSCTDSTDETFTGQSIEEFADKCFNNISDTVVEDTSVYPTTQNEGCATAVGENIFLTQDNEELIKFADFGGHVTSFSVSSSNNHYSNSPPLPGLFDNKGHELPDDIAQSSGSNDHQILEKNIEKYQPLFTTSHVDFVSNDSWFQERSCSPTVSTRHSSSVASSTSEDISSLTVTQLTVSLDRSGPEMSDMTSPTDHTNVRLSNIESAAEAEGIKLMPVVKGSRDISSYPNSEVLIDTSDILENSTKQKIDDAHSKLRSSSPYFIMSREREAINKEETPEKKGIPTFISTDEKEKVMDEFSKMSPEIGYNNAAIYHNALSGVFDMQGQWYEQMLPENALAHTTVGVPNDGQQEYIIEPMVKARDNQGRQFCIPSFYSEQNKFDVNVADIQGKLEIANVISSIITLQEPVLLSQQSTNDSEDLAREDPIVPIVLSHDQQQIALNVLDAWANGDMSSKPSAFQHAVNEFKILHKQEKASNTSLKSAKSIEADTTNENINDSKQNSNTSLHTSFSIIETEEISPMLISHEWSKNSTTDLAKIADARLVSVSPETQETATLTPFDPPTVPAPDQVILRKKLKQSTDFTTKTDTGDQTIDPGSTFITRRPRSMIVTSSHTTSKYEDLHKSVTTESRPVPALRPLTALRPLSSSTASMLHHGSTAFNRPSSGSFSSSTFTSKIHKSDYPKVRQEDGRPFQVDVIKGIVGLGLKVKVTPDGNVQVTEVTRGGPVDKDGQIHIGDYILFINSTEVTGQTDARVQQILRLLPRGLTKLVVSAAAPTSIESQPGNFDHKSSISLTQPFMGDKLQSRTSLNSDHSKIKLVSETSHVSQPKNVFHSLQVNSSISTANSFHNASEAHVLDQIESSVSSEKILLPSQSSEGLESSRKSSEMIKSQPKSNEVTQLPLKSSEKVVAPSRNNEEIENSLLKSDKFEKVDSLTQSGEIPILVTATSKHDHFVAKMPEQTLIQMESDINVHSKENIILKETHDSTLNTKPVPSNIKSEEDNIPLVQHAEVLNQITEEKLNENFISNVFAHPELIGEIKPVIKTSKDLSPESISLAHPDFLEPKVTARMDIKSEIQEKVCSMPEEKLESIKPLPRKVPPPVAPKPRMGVASFRKSQDSVDGSQPAWPPFRKTDNDKLQADILLKSVVADTPGSFVSSTAKMFDDITVSSSSAVHKTLVTRQISKEMEAQTNSNKTMNTSLFPTTEGNKNMLNRNYVPLAQPLPLSRPRTLNYTASEFKEVGRDEDYTKTRENFSDKSSSIISPTHLNAALSPRKTSSLDSPTSPPQHAPRKRAPMIKDESADALEGNKGKTIHHLGIYQSTPLAFVKNKSASFMFSKEKTLTHSDKDVYSASSQHEHNPLTSTSSSSLSTKEDELQKTMKQFDALLSDDFLPSANTLLTSHAETVEGIKNPHLHTSEVNKPVALPRRKIEHNQDNLKSQVTENEQDNQAKGSEEISSVENEKNMNVMKENLMIEETEEAQTKCLAEVSQPMNTALEINNMAGKRDNVSISLTDEIYRFGEKNTPNETVETSSENEIRQTNQIFEVPNKSPDADSSNTTDSNAGCEKLLQHGLAATNTNDLGIQLFHSSDSHKERTTGDEFSDSGYHQSIKSSRNGDLSSFENEGLEKNETQIGLLEVYAHELVNKVMTRIMNDPETLPEKKITDMSTRLFKEEVSSLSDKPDVEPDVPCLYLENIKEHSTPTKLKESHVVSNQTDNLEENKMVVNLTSPQHGSDSSNHSADALDVNLTSPLDMLSEDSGMPADDDEDLTIEDVISSPTQFMDNESHVAKKVPFSVKNEPGCSPISSTVQEHGVLILSDFASKTFGVNSLGNLTNENCDKVHKLLTSTSTDIIATVQTSSTKCTADFSSQDNLTSVQTSDSTLLPTEITLLSDNITPNNHWEHIEKVPVNKSAPEIKGDLTSEHQFSSATGYSSQPGTCIEDFPFKSKEVPSATVVSKRKWRLVSSRSKAPVLSGDSCVPVYVHYTETTLADLLPPGILVSTIVQANAVLDAMSAPDNLLLIVVYVHSSDDYTALHFDLLHTGSICFQVTGIRKSSFLLEECDIKDGDSLISVDHEWCDQATLATFQCKLTNWRQDHLLVLARGWNDVNVKVPVQPKTIPSPRSRSFESNTEIYDFTDAEPESEQRLHSQKLSSLAMTHDQVQQLHTQALSLLDDTFSFSNYTPSLSNEVPPLPEEAPPLPNEAPPLTDKAPPFFSEILTLAEEAPSLSEVAPSLPDKAPPLPNEAPTLPDHAPSLPVVMQPLPNKAPQHSQRVPSLYSETPPIPEKKLPSLDQMPVLNQAQQHFDQTLVLVDQTPPIPDYGPPLIEHTESASDHTPPLDQVSSAADQVSHLLDKVLMKETLPYSEEKREMVSNKISHVVHTQSNIVTETDHTADVKTPLEYKISERQETNTSKHVRPLLETSSGDSGSLKGVNNKSSVASSDRPASSIHKIVMMKGATGIGFCIEGGIGSPKGNMPIIIKRIFKGGPAEKCGQLKVQDEILEVNGVKFDAMRHFEAWNHLKFLDDGEIHITIRRSSS